MAEMAKYKATIMDADTGSHETYSFEAPAHLFEKSRMKLIDAFMDYVDHVQLPKEDVGYEIQSAFKDREHRVVTAIGVLLLEHGEIPFMAMITEQND